MFDYKGNSRGWEWGLLFCLAGFALLDMSSFNHTRRPAMRRHKIVFKYSL